MDNSYINEIKNSFPEIKMPLSEAQLSQIEATAKLQPQTKFVARSERMSVMQAELERVNGQLNAATKMAEFWCGKGKPARKGDRRMPKFELQDVYAKEYEDDGTGPAVRECLDAAVANAAECIDRMANAAAAMNDTLLEGKEYLERSIEAEVKGQAGEDKVMDYIFRKLTCPVLSGVILPGVQENENSPKTAETDLLVIAASGVYVCEVKNYGKAGQTLEVQQNGHIIKRDYYGNVLDDMGSPFEQNARHRNAVQKVLLDAGLGHLPIYPVVIIGNTDVTVNNQSDYIITDMYGFCNIVEKHIASGTHSADSLRAAQEAIQAKRMGERKFPITVLGSEIDKFEVATNMLATAMQQHEEWIQETDSSVNAWMEEVNVEWWKSHRRVARWANAYGLVLSVRLGVLIASFVWMAIGIVLFFVDLICEFSGNPEYGMGCSLLVTASIMCCVISWPLQIASSWTENRGSCRKPSIRNDILATVGVYSLVVLGMVASVTVLLLFF